MESLQDYEQKHIEILRNTSSECTLFLQKNNQFPIEKPCKVLLAGSGARNTIKGGTGSGDVACRNYITCEQGLKNANFEIVSEKWLEEYSTIKKNNINEYLKNVKNEASKHKTWSFIFGIGCIQPEPEYNINLNYEADIAIYVLARNSGEGQDRKLIKGDALLTNTEIKDILFLNEKFEKFLLVLNVGRPIDLSPIKNVNNILLLSQLGIVTGDILANIILGKTNPSGKLSTTWPIIENYKLMMENFGDLNDTKYKEGVYVGYRYFDSFNINVLYHFGYGLSYSEFEINKISVTNVKNIINVKVLVKNVSNFQGKEVVQIYISPSQENKDKPYQSLIAFKKTKNLLPQENEELEIIFNFNDIARYDEKISSYILDKGNYIIRVGNSSNKTSIYGIINLKEDIIIEQLLNTNDKPDFEDIKSNIKYEDDLSNIEKIYLNKEDFTFNKIEYNKKIPINQNLNSLSNEELSSLCLGNYNNSIFDELGSVIGAACNHIVGGAGETTSKIKSINKYLTMTDGPAGIRIAKRYIIDKNNNKYLLDNDPNLETMKLFIPSFIFYFLDQSKNSKKIGEIHYQYTTAIPIETALAQSFNEDFLYKIGNIISNEMDIFKINLWLAPAINIHRNILCGRNFEYYSEDPLLTGKMAAAITKGVQSHKNRGVTIKHFACNNQEYNRNNNNSIISERALREIYLKSFQIVIKESNPHALMTSYNLINGVHSSERKDLIKNVLRNEWNYEGLIMSDWMKTGRSFYCSSKHPAQFASKNIIGGNNLTMPGLSADCKDIINALKKNLITREDLLENASFVMNTIEKLNKED